MGRGTAVASGARHVGDEQASADGTDGAVIGVCRDPRPALVAVQSRQCMNIPGAATRAGLPAKTIRSDEDIGLIRRLRAMQVTLA